MCRTLDRACATPPTHASRRTWPPPACDPPGARVQRLATSPLRACSWRIGDDLFLLPALREDPGTSPPHPSERQVGPMSTHAHGPFARRQVQQGVHPTVHGLRSWSCSAHWESAWSNSNACMQLLHAFAPCHMCTPCDHHHQPPPTSRRCARVGVRHARNNWHTSIRRQRLALATVSPRSAAFCAASSWRCCTSMAWSWRLRRKRRQRPSPPDKPGASYEWLRVVWLMTLRNGMDRSTIAMQCYITCMSSRRRRCNSVEWTFCSPRPKERGERDWEKKGETQPNLLSTHVCITMLFGLCTRDTTGSMREEFGARSF